MKKKLEADLMSIAHRVLQMKNKSDINQLYVETRKLYEKLAILQFVEEHFEGAKPTIGKAEIVEKIEQIFEESHLTEVIPSKIQDDINEKKSEISSNEKVVETIEEVIEIEEEINDNEIVVATDENTEEILEIKEAEEKMATPPDLDFSTIGFQPSFELNNEIEEEVEEKIKAKNEEPQISFFDLLGSDYKDPLFEKVDQTEEKPTPIAFNIDKDDDFHHEELLSSAVDQKTASLNEKLSKGINIDLNDRIAFVKHLFGNSNEDYSRVLNQLITYDSFEEAQSFIEEMVKPDYNRWEGKEDYAHRFIEIIEKKFA